MKVYLKYKVEEFGDMYQKLKGLETERELFQAFLLENIIFNVGENTLIIVCCCCMIRDL